MDVILGLPIRLFVAFNGEILPKIITSGNENLPIVNITFAFRFYVLYILS